MGTSESRDLEAMLNERVDRLLNAYPPTRTRDREFLGAQFDAGLAFVHFPEGDGGLGFAKEYQQLITNRLARVGAPSGGARNPIGYGMVAPTLVTIGSAQLKQRYLRPLFTSEHIWCQLFSEPGAGSDVAGLSTRAVRDGDEWVINGQKVWTTLAHTSMFGLLLARSDPDVEKHNGLTYFVVDMHAAGVDVRPLRQMTGDAEFNEVYFSDVRVSDAHRLGEVGAGWRGALVTLMNERVAIGGTPPPRGSGPIATATALWSGLPADRATPDRRDRLVQLWIESEVERLTRIRATVATENGAPGPEGSLCKLAVAEGNKRIYDFCLDLIGAKGMLYDSYEMRRPDTANVGGSPARSFLRSRAHSVEGGTSEVMRNILGERILGLPGDVRVDKGVPWSQVARN